MKHIFVESHSKFFYLEYREQFCHVSKFYLKTYKFF
jgi:hypothetical protein